MYLMTGEYGQMMVMFLSGLSSLDWLYELLFFAVFSLLRLVQFGLVPLWLVFGQLYIGGNSFHSSAENPDGGSLYYGGFGYRATC